MSNRALFHKEKENQIDIFYIHNQTYKIVYSGEICMSRHIYIPVLKKKLKKYQVTFENLLEKNIYWNIIESEWFKYVLYWQE